LNPYEHFKYNQLDPSDYPTLDTRIISAFYEHIDVYKGTVSLDTSRFNDKDYVIDKLKDVFSILIEFY